MARLLRARRPTTADPLDVELAGRLGQRRAAVREAERALLAALRDGWTGPDGGTGRDGGPVGSLHRALDARFGEALEAAEAAYRLALGPVRDLPRVKYLARLVRPEVKAADRARRELALARTHYRVAASDDLAVARPAAVPPSVGTHPTAPGTRQQH